MSNVYGIFASSIDHNIDMSVRTVQKLVRTDEHAERIVRLAALTLAIRTGYTVEEEDASIREWADMYQLKVARRVALVKCALSQVESAYTTYHRIHGSGEGFEAPAPISDTRSAGELAYAVLMLA